MMIFVVLVAICQWQYRIWLEKHGYGSASKYLVPRPGATTPRIEPPPGATSPLPYEEALEKIRVHEQARFKMRLNRGVVAMMQFVLSVWTFLGFSGFQCWRVQGRLVLTGDLAQVSLL